MFYADDDSVPGTQDHRWLPLESVAEVEGWMDLHDRELRKLVGDKPGEGQGICFTLVHGGEIYLHTNSEGEILLDVTEEASWAAPVISAVSQTPMPRGQIWLLPQHVLIELILGLNTLIASSRLVASHGFRLRA